MVLVIAETIDGKLRKTSFEAVHYGSKVAEMLNTKCIALILGKCSNAGALGTVGANEVLQIDHEHLQSLDTQVYSKVIAHVANDKQATTVILSDTSTGRSLMGRIAVQLNAGSVRGVNKLPELVDGKLHFKRLVFSGKATATCRIESDKSVITLMGNSLKPVPGGSEIQVSTFDLDVPSPKTKVISVKRSTGTVPLPEAEIVVSAGRGMKDPGNWQMIEDLAQALGATTACSRPVADSGWRPHHEHVGQTGIAIRPNLYIAIGISGAIQHLAGINSSKVIVVINKDPEAPFFKAADYGVVGDLFDIVPRLTDAIKEFKSTHH